MGLNRQDRNKVYPSQHAPLFGGILRLRTSPKGGITGRKAMRRLIVPRAGDEQQGRSRRLDNAAHSNLTYPERKMKDLPPHVGFFRRGAHGVSFCCIGMGTKEAGAQCIA